MLLFFVSVSYEDEDKYMGALAHTHKHINTQTQTRTHTCMHTHTKTRTNTRMHPHTRAHTYTHTHFSVKPLQKKCRYFKCVCVCLDSVGSSGSGLSSHPACNGPCRPSLMGWTLVSTSLLYISRQDEKSPPLARTLTMLR